MNHRKTHQISEIHGVSISKLSATLAIPVWAKALESLRHDGLLQDTYALRITQTMEFDWKRFENAWKSQIGIIARTRHFDKYITSFLQKHPCGTIVSLGCGLDARSYRLDNGTALWVDLDLPEVIQLRKTIFTEDERHTMLGKSVLDYSWMAEIPQKSPVAILAEGVLMYLPSSDVEKLISMMAESFCGGELFVELISPLTSRLQKKHDSVKPEDAPFQWSVTSPQKICAWSPSIDFIEAKSWAEGVPKNRLKGVRFLSWLPVIKNMDLVCHYRFQAKNSSYAGK